MSARTDGQVPAPTRAGTAPAVPDAPNDQEAAKTRTWLAKHLAWHHDPACWHCRAARLVAALPAPAPVTADPRDRLSRDIDAVEQAAGVLDDVIARFDAEHGHTLRAAVRSLAVTSGSPSLDRILRTAQGSSCDTPDEAATRMRLRLRRIRGLHAQLVAELSGGVSWRDRPALARVVAQLATAWHGTDTASPRGPLTDD